MGVVAGRPRARAAERQRTAGHGPGGGSTARRLESVGRTRQRHGARHGACSAPADARAARSIDRWVRAGRVGGWAGRQARGRAGCLRTARHSMCGSRGGAAMCERAVCKSEVRAGERGVRATCHVTLCMPPCGPSAPSTKNNRVGEAWLGWRVGEGVRVVRGRGRTPSRRRRRSVGARGGRGGRRVARWPRALAQSRRPPRPLRDEARVRRDGGDGRIGAAVTGAAARGGGAAARRRPRATARPRSCTRH